MTTAPIQTSQLQSQRHGGAVTNVSIQELARVMYPQPSRASHYAVARPQFVAAVPPMAAVIVIVPQQ